MKILRQIIIYSVSVLIIATGYFVNKKLSGLKKPPEKKEYSQGVAVRVQEVIPQDIQMTVTGYGKVESVRSVAVIAEVSGRIVKMNPKLKVGNFVEKDEILVEIDSRNYRVQKERLQAIEQKWLARIAQMEQEKKNLNKQIEIFLETVALTKGQTDRTSQLTDTGIASQQLWDQDKLAHLAQKNRLVELVNNRDIIPSRISEAKAELLAVKAQITEAEIDLERTVIRAPFAARIQETQMEEGYFVNVGGTMAVLDDYSAVEIPVMISQTEFYDLGLSTEEIRSLSMNHKKIMATVFSEISHKKFSWTGQVIRVEPLNPKNRTIPVIVRVENPWAGDELKPVLMSGVFCEVEIQGPLLKNVIAVPYFVIHSNNTVYIAKNSQLDIREVKIQNNIGDMILIKNGIAAGETIVLSRLAVPVKGMKLLVNKTTNQDGGK